VDVALHVVERGEGKPVLLLHGFPELAYSWRHQIDALADAGYRVLAPDMRGFGRSEAPPEVEAYDVVELCGDVTRLLDGIGAERAARRSRLGRERGLALRAHAPGADRVRGRDQRAARAARAGAAAPDHA